jgi:ribosomal protein S6
MSETTMRVYELGFLLVPSTAETEVPSLVDTLKASITEAGGTVHSTGTPEFIDLAYTIEKNVASKKMKWSQGYFGWVKFEANPEAMETIKKALDANTNVIRYLLVKTTLDNSIVFKKPKNEAKRITSEDEEVLLDEELIEEDMKEDHELLPDLQSDIVTEDKEGEE